MPLAPQEIRTFFVTTATANRRRLFQVERNAELFLEVLQQNRTKGRLQLHAFVIMPDHVHLLLTPAPEISLEKAMQFLKGGFSFQLKSKLDVWTPASTSTASATQKISTPTSPTSNKIPYEPTWSNKPTTSNSHPSPTPTSQTHTQLSKAHRHRFYV